MDTYKDTTLTKHILQLISNECSISDIEIDETFCVYLINLLLLDPKWKIYSSVDKEENIKKFVEFCIEKLKNINLSYTTLYLQQYFLENASDKKQMNLSAKEKLRKCLTSLHDEIFSIDPSKVNKYIKKKLLKNIISYVTLLSGIGNPTHTLVYKEAQNALNSVFDEKDLDDFIKMKKQSKEIQLNYLKKLVTGIRLFNSDCGKKSAGIEDVPKILSQASHACQIELQKALLQIMEKVNLLTSAIENCYDIESDGNCQYNLVAQFNDLITEEVLDEAKDMLILCRQHEVYVRKLLVEVDDIEALSKVLFDKLADTLSKLHNATKFRVAVPTNQIYPLFIELAEVWFKIQDETICLSMYNESLQKINDLVKEFATNEHLKLSISTDAILTDAMRLERTMGLRIKSTDNKCKILESNRISDFERIPLQFLGFCAWTLAVTAGGLIPGNPNMGVLKWNNKCYVFSSLEAAKMFGYDPDRYVKLAMNTARNKPELINLLQLYEELTSIRDIEELHIKPSEITLKNNIQTQTDLHPIIRNKHPDYNWNVWHTYRQFMKSANIETCRTRSTQTSVSQ